MKEDSYEVRLTMAKMHEKYINELDKAMEDGAYVEASWLCYAIFEQRVQRIIEKYISVCPKQRRSKKDRAIGISTKLDCIGKLAKVQYGPFKYFDGKLVKEIKAWCKTRNALTHGLVSLEHYKKYDQEFEALAKAGAPLVSRLYEEATRIREWYRDENNHIERFPNISCQCKRHCIFEKE